MTADKGEDEMKPVRIFFAVLMLGMLLASGMSLANAAAADTNWVWISSDSKYSKFYAPARVKVTNSIRLDDGKTVATEIQAWTKTEYSYEGAAETIKNYGIQTLLPNPARLKYSLALVQINPQNRLLEYVQEDFYDEQGNVIWSKIYNPRTIKEINSQAFDEDFYAFIVDTVFHQGEAARTRAKERWHPLWSVTAGDGSAVSSIADTSTMRLKAENLIFWEWVEEKDTKGTVREIKFMKKAVDLARGRQKVVAYKYWSPSGGWQDLTGTTDGKYVPIQPGTHEADGLRILRAFATGYHSWVTRYSLES